MRPNAGEAIGLQLQMDRSRILPVRISLHTPLDAENILDVVADLVGQNVGLREFAGRAEALPELIVKAQVDVDLFVPRTIEGAGGGFGAAAAGLRVVAKE